MPRWFIATPSETEIVVISNGVPPAAATPAFAASACGRSDFEQGVLSPWVLTTATNGRASAASSSPIARRNVRCGVRSRPSTATRERRRLSVRGAHGVRRDYTTSPVRSFGSRISGRGLQGAGSECA